MGIGLTLILIILGAIREVLSNGTLFQNIHFILGDEYQFLTIQLFTSDNGFLLASLPPGAFLALSFLILIMNLINKRLK
jgi:electron transport complex protein RnfE